MKITIVETQEQWLHLNFCNCAQIIILKQQNLFKYNGYMTSEKMNNNFKVAVRIRPPLPNDQTKVKYFMPTSNQLCVDYPHHSYGQKNKKFVFDRIYPQHSNKQIFDTLVKQHLDIVLKEDRNLTILTYGITGSGKTHTIFGNKNQGGVGEQGLAHLAFADLLESCTKSIKFEFSYIQIYNEQVHDLLCTTEEISTITPRMKSLNVLEDANGRIYIQDLSKFQVQTISQIQKLIDKGNTLRTSSSNHINMLSSRSHALLQLVCIDSQSNIRNTLTIIDLAGSEKVIQTTLQQQNKSNNLQKEGSNINKSLLALGNCIKGLQNGESHIPYRDSKLTRILKEDLSGKSQNLMIACVSANIIQVEETLNTLQYASKASNIKVHMKRNQSQLNNQGYYECPQCMNRVQWKSILPSKLILNQNTKNGQAKLSTQYLKLLEHLEEKIIGICETELPDNSNSDRSLFRHQYPENNEKMINLMIKEVVDQFQKELSQLLSHQLNEVQEEWKRKLQNIEKQKQIEENKLISEINNLRKKEETIKWGQLSKTRKVKPILTDSNRQMFSQEECQQYDSNPRRRKRISIIQNHIGQMSKQDSANTTLDNTAFLENKMHKMAPDEDQQGTPGQGMKETILKKLERARVRVGSLPSGFRKENIEVSAFDSETYC